MSASIVTSLLIVVIVIVVLIAATSAIESISSLIEEVKHDLIVKHDHTSHYVYRITTNGSGTYVSVLTDRYVEHVVCLRLNGSLREGVPCRIVSRSLGTLINTTILIGEALRPNETIVIDLVHPQGDVERALVSTRCDDVEIKFFEPYPRSQVIRTRWRAAIANLSYVMYLRERPGVTGYLHNVTVYVLNSTDLRPVGCYVVGDRAFRSINYTNVTIGPVWTDVKHLACVLPRGESKLVLVANGTCYIDVDEVVVMVLGLRACLNGTDAWRNYAVTGAGLYWPERNGTLCDGSIPDVVAVGKALTIKLPCRSVEFNKRYNASYINKSLTVSDVAFEGGRAVIVFNLTIWGYRLPESQEHVSDCSYFSVLSYVEGLTKAKQKGLKEGPDCDDVGFAVVLNDDRRVYVWLDYIQAPTEKQYKFRLYAAIVDPNGGVRYNYNYSVPPRETSAQLQIMLTTNPQVSSITINQVGSLINVTVPIEMREVHRIDLFERLASEQRGANYYMAVLWNGVCFYSE